jgi:hypothetical protein
MAFLALGSTNLLDGHAIHFTVFELFMEFVVNAVEFIAIAAGRIGKVDLGGTMAVDTPAHAQIGELFDLVHFLDRTMAGLALDLAGANVLGMAEEYVIRQVMDLYPFDGFTRLGIFTGFGIVAGEAI